MSVAPDIRPAPGASASFAPTTMILWLSCEMEVATAPEASP